jgi:hypothetical protein
VRLKLFGREGFLGAGHFDLDAGIKGQAVGMRGPRLAETLRPEAKGEVDAANLIPGLNENGRLGFMLGADETAHAPLEDFKPGPDGPMAA